MCVQHLFSLWETAWRVIGSSKYGMYLVILRPQLLTHLSNTWIPLFQLLLQPRVTTQILERIDATRKLLARAKVEWQTTETKTESELDWSEERVKAMLAAEVNLLKTPKIKSNVAGKFWIHLYSFTVYV